MSVSTALAVPGSSRRFLLKGLASAADVVMLDLEDGVGEDQKATARELLTELLHGRSTADQRAWLRINAIDTGHYADDVDLLSSWPTQITQTLPLVVPMATSAAIDQVGAALPGSPLVAMIETAAGVEDALVIARHPQVRALMFGELDFLATMSLVGATRLSDTTWAHARVINAAAAAGKGVIAGPFADIADEDGLTRAADADAAIGFAGKLCIHPSQLGPVRAAFAPTDEEIRWATSLLEELRENPGRGAFRFEGRMVDAPVIDRARAVLAHSGATA